MQRYVRLFGTPITLLALLALLIWGARWGYRNVMAPVPPHPATPCMTQSVGSQLKTGEVTVRVFNGGTKSGLAATVGSQLTGLGFKVSRTGNTDERIKQTVIVGHAASDPEVKLVAAFFKGATVRGDGRVDHTVDVLVGNNFGGIDASAPKTLAVPSGKVCLPSPAPSASA